MELLLGKIFVPSQLAHSSDRRIEDQRHFASTGWKGKESNQV
jgi:hypothetical protein